MTDPWQGQQECGVTMLTRWLCRRPGHRWQNRFYSCAREERHLWTAFRCVEQNPVRAGLAIRAEDYTWSSAAAHLGAPDETNLL